MAVLPARDPRPMRFDELRHVKAPDVSKMIKEDLLLP
jgi:hypothetical protein